MRNVEILSPATVAELAALRKSRPEAVPVAGATTFMSRSDTPVPDLPPVILSLANAPELRAITRTDRYVEVGAMTTFAELLALREGTLPAIVRERAARVGTPTVRNLATIGGSLACPSRFRDLFAPLACLDALAEFRTQRESVWINVNRLAAEDGKPSPRTDSILSRVRMPAEEWDLSLARRYGLDGRDGPRNAVLACVCRVTKRAIAEIRIAEAGALFLRSREAENMLIGRRLPLAERDKDAALEAYARRAQELGISDFSTARFLGALKSVFGWLDRGGE